MVDHTTLHPILLPRPYDETTCLQSPLAVFGFVSRGYLRVLNMYLIKGVDWSCRYDVLLICEVCM